MNMGQVVFSIPDGVQATLAFPDPMTPEVIDMLERTSALIFHSLRRDAHVEQARQAGAIEYDSWAAGVGAGAIEYDSWSARI
jgi:hypothetical protein